MVGCHGLDGQEFEQVPGDGEGQGTLPAGIVAKSPQDWSDLTTTHLAEPLAGYSPWGSQRALTEHYIYFIFLYSNAHTSNQSITETNLLNEESLQSIYYHAHISQKSTVILFPTTEKELQLQHQSQKLKF